MSQAWALALGQGAREGWGSMICRPLACIETSLCLSFLIGKMGMMVRAPTSESYAEDEVS